MTDTSHRRSPATDESYERGPTAWAGWVVFGGVMLIMMGTFQAIEGFIAVFNDDFYLVRPSGLVINVDYSTWGWTHVVIGVVAVLTGAGLLAGNTAARVVGVGIAVLSALVNLAFISAYPVWSTILIALDVIVIYAITVHGRELKTGYR